MELRYYQIEAVDAWIKFFTSAPDAWIIVACTWAGKSLYIAKIAEAINEKVIILQPSKELLEQNYEKFTMLWWKAKIFSASFWVKEIGKVTYATIWSINKHCAKLKKMWFTKLIIDECDRYSKAWTWQLGTFIKQVGFTHTLWLTATPFKNQTNSMNGSNYTKIVMLTNRGRETNFFKRIINVLQIQDIIKMWFWSKLEYEQYDTDVSWLVYNSTKSDFTEESIKKVYHSNDIHWKIIQKIKDLDDRKSILVFCPSVEEAKMLSDMVKWSVVVSWDMDKKERAIVIDKIKKWEIRIIFNYQVLWVWFDYPELDCIILGRSTGSLGSYYQWLWRWVRLHKDKDYCLIVDFWENIKRFWKIEHLSYQLEWKNWKLYWEDNKLLSWIPIHTIWDLHKDEQQDIEMSFWKYKWQMMSNIPDEYLQWSLDNITWNSYNRAIKLRITNKLTHWFSTCNLTQNNYNASVKNRSTWNTVELLYRDWKLLWFHSIGKTKSNLPFTMLDRDSRLKICNL